MKTAGAIVLILGLLMTLYALFAYVTKVEAVDLGEVEITASTPSSAIWQPYAGIGAMVLGGFALKLGSMKPQTT